MFLSFCLFKEQTWESQGLRFPSHSSSWKNTDNCDDSPQATDSKSASGKKIMFLKRAETVNFRRKQPVKSSVKNSSTTPGQKEEWGKKEEKKRWRFSVLL